MKQQTTTLSLSNVYKRFGDIEAVSDATMNVVAGEVIGFVGPNGAGKTTALSMVMGFLKPSRGTVRVLGKIITPEKAHRVHKQIGYLAADMVLPSALTGEQFLTFMNSRNGRDQIRYEQLLHELKPVLNRPLKTLSRGNKQKVSLIAALQHTPEVLILDEPTSGLDPLMQDIFLRVIATESKRGTTVLMSSHILSEVSDVCSRIIFMRGGKFILDQPIAKITNQLGKHVVITSREAQKLYKYLPVGVERISHTTDQIRVAVPTADLKPFLRWLVTKDFTDVTIEERDLDDVFHELYSVGKAKK